VRLDSISRLGDLWLHKYDAAYITYVDRNKSTALWIVRVLVKNIDTNGKWIDVRLMESGFCLIMILLGMGIFHLLL